MYIAVLLILNIPVFLFVGWVIFDTADNAAESIYETIGGILKAILIPGIIRMALGEDESDGAGSIFQTLVFFVTCGAILYGEHCLIEKYFS